MRGGYSQLNGVIDMPPMAPLPRGPTAFLWGLFAAIFPHCSWFFHCSGARTVVKTRITLPIGIGAFCVAVILFVLSDYGKQSPFVSLAKDDVPPGAEGIDLDNYVDLEQEVTTNIQPVDAIFVDFEKNWRNFISRRDELTLQVVETDDDEPRDPLIFSECVFSEGAGAYVPLMTLTWVEPAPVSDTEPLRFDLTTHYQGFQRESYTTIFPVEVEQRFKLPMQSSLVENTEAVLLTGPAIFPKVVGFDQVQLTRGSGVRETDAGTGYQYTIKLQDLAPGLAYKFRKAELVESTWRADQLVTFSTPVCPQEF
jgi:hypothetical protein